MRQEVVEENPHPLIEKNSSPLWATVIKMYAVNAG
jgi:hypothetical protein